MKKLCENLFKRKGYDELFHLIIKPQLIFVASITLKRRGP